MTVNAICALGVVHDLHGCMWWARGWGISFFFFGLGLFIGVPIIFVSGYLGIAVLAALVDSLFLRVNSS